jgi:pantoate--beta-alanine ligase
MKVTGTVKGIREELKKNNLSPISLVPTMGALHEGHLSLVRNAIASCPVAVVSIYVNPAQFNDKNDLANYPRTIDADLALLKTILRENDIVFSPPDSEIYPAEDTRTFHFGNLDKVMEALHRPGHFNGVAKVVSRLFDIIAPDLAYFGLKDFQQLAVIKELVRQEGHRVRIIECPIIRENDGLAMSSRNRLLDPLARKAAPLIYKTISAAAGMFRDREISDIRRFVEESFADSSLLNLEYFEIVDDTGLVPVRTRDELKKGKCYRGCIAVRAGNTRLIDNIPFL